MFAVKNSLNLVHKTPPPDDVRIPGETPKLVLISTNDEGLGSFVVNPFQVFSWPVKTSAGLFQADDAVMEAVAKIAAPFDFKIGVVTDVGQPPDLSSFGVVSVSRVSLTGFKKTVSDDGKSSASNAKNIEPITRDDDAPRYKKTVEPPIDVDNVANSFVSPAKTVKVWERPRKEMR